MDMARKTAYDILYKVFEKGAYGDYEIARIDKTGTLDTAFIRRLVYGVTEKKIYLDYVLDRFLNKGSKKTELNILTILRMGVYQIEFMDSVPDYAAINTSVELGKKLARGREGLINAVLRNYIRERKQVELPDPDKNWSNNISIKYSIHESIVKLWEEEFGREKAEATIKALENHEEIAVRVNLGKTDRKTIAKKFDDIGIVSKTSSISDRSLILTDVNGVRITELDIYKDGLISVQGQESCYIADMVSPSREDKVLDACAAPGGKTTAMAEVMAGLGEICAWDLYAHRIKKIDEQARRLKLNNIKTEVWDSSKTREEYIGAFDKVLVDAPCSGLGVIRRKPEIRYRDMSDKGDGLAAIQLEILTSCSQYVKPRGKLVYSTCTVNERENRGVIERFLGGRDFFKLTHEEQLMPYDGFDGFYIAELTKS